jgi:DNA-binding beta-propeller fold protein YncE
VNLVDVRRFVAAGVIAVVLPACGGEIPRYALDGGFGPTDPPPISMHGRLVVTNNGDDSLSVVDASDGTGPALRVPVGLQPIEPEGPHHLSAAPDGSALYVNISYSVVGGGGGPHGAHGNGTMPGFVLKLATSDGSLLAKTLVDRNPGDNELSPDGATLYVSHYDLPAWTKGVATGNIRDGDSNLIAIDTATMTVKWKVAICPAAHGLRLSHDGNTLYATCAPDEIAVVDLTATPIGVRRVPLPGFSEGEGCLRCPYAVSVAPDDSVWVASLGPSSGRDGQGGIDVYDPATGAFDPARKLNMLGRALFPAFVPAAAAGGGYRVYVPEQQGVAGDFVRVYDVAAAGDAGVEAAPIGLDRASCQNAHIIDIDAGATQARVVCEGDHTRPGSMVFVDLAAQSVSRTVPLGVFPDDIAVVP